MPASSTAIDADRSQYPRYFVVLEPGFLKRLLVDDTIRISHNFIGIQCQAILN